MFFCQREPLSSSNDELLLPMYVERMFSAVALVLSVDLNLKKSFSNSETDAASSLHQLSLNRHC
jgi:hypothetical protein